MSFIIDIEVGDLTEEQARAVAMSCARRGAWPLQVALRPRWRRALRRRRMPAARLWVPREQDLLSDEATTGAPTWAMDPGARDRFADSIVVLGEEVPQGFSLRACWVGSPVHHEERLTAGQLAELTRSSGLNELTRYVVKSPAAPPCLAAHASLPTRVHRGADDQPGRTATATAIRR